MHEIRCGNAHCPTRPLIAEEPSTAYEDRTPCPVCSSKSREFHVTVSSLLAPVDLTVGGSVQASAAVLSAPAVMTAGSVDVDGSVEARPQSRPASPLGLAFVGLPVTHEIVVKYRDLGEPPDPVCLIEISTREGTVLASGGGVTPADALSVMFERMLPPTSSEAHDPDDDPPLLDDAQ